MDERIDVAFTQLTRTGNTRRLRISRGLPGGIQFDEPDPIERTVGIQLAPRGEATRQRMKRIAQVKGWQPGEFRLNVSVEDGALVLRGVDRDSLPEGLYALTIEIEEAVCTPRRFNLSVENNGSDQAEFQVWQDPRDVAVDLDGGDADELRLIEASSIDGVDGRTWLDEDHRAVRKACFLNLVASLRVRPTVSDALIDQVLGAFAVFNDRIYTRVGPDLLPRVQELVKDDNRPFYAEGAPTASIHQRLLRDLPEPPEIKSRFTNGLLSFRGEGGPSLQMVIAVPPVGLPYTYAEFDLDMGNPLQDALGFVVHMGELLSGKPTNHLDLRKDLAKTKAKPYLLYDVVSGF